MGFLEGFRFSSKKPENSGSGSDSRSDFIASPERTEASTVPTEEELKNKDKNERIDYLRERIDFLRTGKTDFGPDDRDEVIRLQAELDGMLEEMTPKSY